MSLAAVTGTDRTMFWQTLMLLESAASELPLRVCDFGLEPAQAAYLRRRGQLLERPDDALPADYRHVFYLKSALIEFVRPAAAGMVAWLDADALIAPGGGAALQALARGMAEAGETIAAASDDDASFDSFCDRAAPRHPNVEVFRAAFRADGLAGGTDYLNSGVFLCRPSFLAAWKAAAFALPMHVILDQNAFNLAARRPGQRLRTLPKAVWNNQGRTLDAVAVVDGIARVAAGDPAPVQVLHATSSFGQVARTPVEIHRFGGLATPTLKLFCDPALQALQTGLLTRAVQAIEPADGLFPVP